jgi:hypothetical protein
MIMASYNTAKTCRVVIRKKISRLKVNKWNRASHVIRRHTSALYFSPCLNLFALDLTVHCVRGGSRAHSVSYPVCNGTLSSRSVKLTIPVKFKYIVTCTL